MNALEIILMLGAVCGGIGVAVIATIQCSIRAAQSRRDRELFQAYIEEPQALEAWLLQGAVEEIRRTVGHK